MIVSVYVLMVACKGSYEPFTQPDPVSLNQEFMLSEVKRLEAVLSMGEFIATFTKPPAEGYAGWADCKPGGRAPWYVHFNKDYIETLDSSRRSYMTALVAHEMCHHWVTKEHGGCYDEMAAETCANNLVTKGRPN